MSKTFVAVCSLPKESASKHACAHPMTGLFGTDFWHAVEFSRNGRAPVAAVQTLTGATPHGATAPRYVRGSSAVKAAAFGHTPRACDRQRGDRAVEVAPGPAADASG